MRSARVLPSQGVSGRQIGIATFNLISHKYPRLFFLLNLSIVPSFVRIGSDIELI